MNAAYTCWRCIRCGSTLASLFYPMAGCPYCRGLLRLVVTLAVPRGA